MEVLLPNNEGNILKVPLFPIFFFWFLLVLNLLSTYLGWKIARLQSGRMTRIEKIYLFFFLNARTHLSMLKTTTVKPVLTEAVFNSHPPKDRFHMTSR